VAHKGPADDGKRPSGVMDVLLVVASRREVFREEVWRREGSRSDGTGTWRMTGSALQG